METSKFKIRNESNTPQRIKLLPKGLNNYHSDLGSNPTQTRNEDGSIVVCVNPFSLISCEGASDTMFIAFNDSIRVLLPQEDVDLILHTSDEKDFRDTLNGLGFAVQDAGDYYLCGDVYRLINTRNYSRQVRFETATGMVEDLYVRPAQSNEAWQVTDLPTDPPVRQVDICFAANTMVVPPMGMQASPQQMLTIPNENGTTTDESPQVNLRFAINGVPVPNVVAGGFDFAAAGYYSHSEDIGLFKNHLKQSLLPLGIEVQGDEAAAQIFFVTALNDYLIVDITSPTPIPEDFIGSVENGGGYYTDANFSYRLRYNNAQDGFKAQFCIVNPNLLE